MAAAVAVPLSTIHSELGGVLPPSAVTQHTPRHGRSRGMSVKGKGARRYSVVEDRDITLAKAVMFVVKRAIQQDEVEEGDDGEYLVADPEGWIGVAELLAHSRVSALGATLDDIQRIVATATKTRFDLRKIPNSEGSPEEATSWQISRITSGDAATAPVPAGDKLTAETPDLPEFVVYETSYQRYPLLVSLGAITRAPGGGQYRAFVPVDDDGKIGDAEVRIWIHLRSALQAEPSLTWHRSEGGIIVTADEVPKSLWTKAVARRPDVGVLFEDGQVRKEVPASLRGKGGKARKGKGAIKREGSGDDSGSASEE